MAVLILFDREELPILFCTKEKSFGEEIIGPPSFHKVGARDGVEEDFEQIWFMQF